MSTDMRIGLWLSSIDPQIGAALLGTDLDVVIADRQHAFVTEETVFALRHAARPDGPGLWVRVPRLDHADIGKALDAGAAGVVVPMVSTPEQAALAASACTLPPTGTRSFGPIIAPAQEPVQCVVMIETVAGVAQAAAIAATPGVTGVLVGTSDLALDLGVPVAEAGIDRDGPVREALRAVADGCRAAGISAGIGVATWESVPAAAELGFDLIVVGGEKGLLRAAVAQRLGEISPD